MSTQPRPLLRWAPPALALAVAAALRLWHIDHGLPDFLEEAIPIKRAFAMWGRDGVDLNPHFFNYPTLVLYLQFALQKLHYAWGSVTGTFGSAADYWLAWQIDPSGPVILARLLGVAADLASVLAVWRLGERIRPGAGALAAGLTAVAAPLVLTSRLIYVEPVMTALMLWALERLDAHARDGRRASLITGVVLIGLATGAKYNAGLLVLPLGAVLWSRGGLRGLLRWPLWSLAAVAVFCATSPYILVEFSEFWQHFSYERTHMATGHLGTDGRHGAAFVLRTLAGDLGWPALALLAFGAVRLALARRRPLAAGEAVVWWALLPLLISIMTFKMTATRYVAPVVPLVALVAAAGAGPAVAGLARRLPAGAMRAAPAVVALLVLVPALLGGARAGLSGSDATQIAARRWLESHVADEAIVLQERYAAHLRTRGDIERVRRNPLFASASADLRSRVDRWRAWRTLSMPLVVSGQYDVVISAGAAERTVRIYERAIDANQLFYDAGILAGVDWFVTSSAVSERFAGDDPAFAAQRRFYRQLAAMADTAAVFRPGGGVTGPQVTVFRLRKGARPPLALDWWRDRVPSGFGDQARAAETALGVSAAQLTVPVDPRLPGWSHYLRPVFRKYLHGFLLDLAGLQIEAGRAAEALPLAEAVNAMLPADPFGAKYTALCLGLTGRGDRALPVIVAARDLNRTGSPEYERLELERARMLAVTGRTDEAAALLADLAGRLPAGSPLRAEAEALRSGLRGR